MPSVPATQEGVLSAVQRLFAWVQSKVNNDGGLNASTLQGIDPIQLERVERKGEKGGYPSLGDDGRVPISQGGARGRNLILNGEMRIAQAGTSFTGLGAATASTLDMWSVFPAGGTTALVTVAQVAHAQPFRKAARITCTTADVTVGAAERLSYGVRIEAQDLQHLKWGTADAKSLTIQFPFKSPKSGKHFVGIWQNDANRGLVMGFTVNAVDTEQQFTLTIPGDTGGTINDDTGPGLEIHFPLLAGSNFDHPSGEGVWASGFYLHDGGAPNLLDAVNNVIEITGVQLEVGSTAGPFEHKTFERELAECMRYLIVDDGSSSAFYSGAAVNTTVARFFRTFFVRMRAIPVVTVSAASDFNVYRPGLALYVATALIQDPGISNSAWTGGVQATIGTASLTAGDSLQLTAATANARVNWDARL